MSTFAEGIPLQPLGSKKVGEDNHAEQLGQDDTTDNAKRSSSEGAVPPVTTSRWTTFFITVAILFSNAFLNAGISCITPFYPIQVSCVSACVHAYGCFGSGDLT